MTRGHKLARSLLVAWSLLQAGADLGMGQDLAALDLRQAFLDFAHEPFVVLDESLDRFARQRLRIEPGW